MWAVTYNPNDGGNDGMTQIDQGAVMNTGAVMINERYSPFETK